MARLNMVPDPRVRRAPPATRHAPHEDARKQFVRLVTIIYLLAIFEGSLRKFVVPQFGQYVFFVRDPFVAWAYLLAWRHGLWPRNSTLLFAATAMCGAGVLLLALQMATGATSDLRLLLGVYGWRNYFLYAPLAILIGEQFRGDDLWRIGRITLALAVPIAALVAAQFFSPVNASINIGTADEVELQFKGMSVTVDHVRATGPFSSNVGQQQFVTTAWAFLLSAFLLPSNRRRIGVVTTLVAAGAILTCVALGGSRGTLLQCVLIGSFALLIGVIGRGGRFRSKALAWPVVLGLGALFLYPLVFPEGFSVFVQRWNTASAAESGFNGGVFGRALYGLVDFWRLVELVPTLGYGLGFGGNASITLHAMIDGIEPGYLAETDFSRHMVDLGFVFGLVYMAFRTAIVIWMARLVWRATRRVSDPLPMMLFAYAGYVMFQGQLTGNGSVHVYGWLFTGFCVAAAREALRSTQPISASLARGRAAQAAPARRPTMVRPRTFAQRIPNR